MTEDRCNRDQLLLAVSGALDAGDERRLSEHLASCGSCAQEIESLREMTTELSRLPTPMPRAGLVERVRRTVHLDLARRADERLDRLVLAFLLFFSWTVTLLGFAGVRLAMGARDEVFAWTHGAGMTWSVAYFAFAWLAGAAALGLVGLYRHRSRPFRPMERPWERTV
jgi:anti-sigma factor RsiW